MRVKETSNGQREVIQFDRPLLLLVEGGDDQAFACAQIGVVGEPQRWHVHSMGGNRTGWSATLQVVMDDTWFSKNGLAVGLVVDADSDADAAFARCKTALASSGLPVPAVPNEAETDGVRRTAVFVAPGAGLGALEDLLLRAAEPGRVALAKGYLERLTELGLGEFEQPQKSLLQAYLAGQGRLVKTIPVAVNRNEVLPAESPAFALFREFLENLATTSPVP